MKSIEAQSVTQYGVQTPASKTVLLVADRLEEAEHILDVVGEGRVLRRTVAYGPWQPVPLSESSGHATAC